MDDCFQLIRLALVLKSNCRLALVSNRLDLAPSLLICHNPRYTNWDHTHQPRGMATARFTGTKEEQFEDAAGGDKSQDSQMWPDVDNPKQQAATQGEGETSKSAGSAGTQPSQAEGEAPAPPEENPQHQHPLTQSQVPARIPQTHQP